MASFKIGLLDEIRIKAQQDDVKAAAAYREGLSDADELLRLLEMLSDDVPQKPTLRKNFSHILRGEFDQIVPIRPASSKSAPKGARGSKNP
jgi:hypothetical protein